MNLGILSGVLDIFSAFFRILSKVNIASMGGGSSTYVILGT